MDDPSVQPTSRASATTASAPPDRPATARERWRALHIVWRWVAVGAVVPSALWAGVVVVGVFVTGPEAAVQGIGYLFLLVIMVGPPGALVGLVLGLVDHRLGRAVERRPRSRRAVAVATVAMSLVIAAAVRVLMLFTSSGVGEVAVVVTCLACAVVPALVTLRRYRRLSAGDVPVAEPAVPSSDRPRHTL